RLCALAWVLGAAPSALSAQSSDSLFATGVRAYKNLEFDLAAWLLRRDLAQLTAAGAPATERAAGLVYLGAADLFRGRRDSAAAVFRRLVQLDPRFRPDRLVFPPEVTSLFDGVRLQTKTVTVELPRDTTIVLGPGAFDIWLIASSFQNVDVTLRYADGAPFRALYAGPIGDSLKVQWDGLDAAGAPPPVNRVVLRVASRAPTGELAGIIQVPLDLRLSRPDTLPWPPAPADAQLLPERARSGAAKRSPLGGLLLSSALEALHAVGGASLVTTRVRSQVPAGVDQFTGSAFLGQGALALGRVELSASYLQGTINPDGGTATARDLVEGTVLIGVHALDWLTLETGPHARAYTLAG